MRVLLPFIWGGYRDAIAPDRARQFHRLRGDNTDHPCKA